MAEEDPGKRKGPPVGSGAILVAVDFSKDSKAALRWACRYADQVGAEILVLHVVHDPVEMPGTYGDSESDVLRPMEDRAAEMMAKFTADFAAANPDLKSPAAMKTWLVSGIPETRILEVAERIDAAMLVVGSRGLTGLPHLLLGSKAERLAQLSPRPVTIVKGRQRDD